MGPLGVAKYGDYVQDINKSGQHLLALVNNILDLSKIEFGESQLGVGTTATVRFPAARIVSVRYAALASDGVDSAVG